MEIIIDDLAKQSLIDIYYYNCQYSLKNATETNRNIISQIHNLEHSPYIGRYIPEISNRCFREILYKSSKHSGYRIMYYVSKSTNKIYIFNILNSKQNFYHFLKLHNYFKNYFQF